MYSDAYGGFGCQKTLQLTTCEARFRRAEGTSKRSGQGSFSFYSLAAMTAPRRDRPKMIKRAILKNWLPMSYSLPIFRSRTPAFCPEPASLRHSLFPG
jgi:hypothetical protein